MLALASLSLSQTFWDGNSLYNVWNFALAVFGVVLSIVGFAFTLYQLKMTRDAASAAKSAAEDVRSHLGHFDAVAEVAAAIATMEEIKRLHLNKAYLLIPDRCTLVRQRLIALRESKVGLTQEQLALVQGAIVQFHELEGRCVVAGADASASSTKQLARQNLVVGEQLDNLATVLAAIKGMTGKVKNG